MHIFRLGQHIINIGCKSEEKAGSRTYLLMYLNKITYFGAKEISIKLFKRTNSTAQARPQYCKYSLTCIWIFHFYFYINVVHNSYCYAFYSCLALLAL